MDIHIHLPETIQFENDFKESIMNELIQALAPLADAVANQLRQQSEAVTALAEAVANLRANEQEKQDLYDRLAELEEEYSVSVEKVEALTDALRSDDVTTTTSTTEEPTTTTTTTTTVEEPTTPTTTEVVFDEPAPPVLEPVVPDAAPDSPPLQQAPADLSVNLEPLPYAGAGDAFDPQP